MRKRFKARKWIQIAGCALLLTSYQTAMATETPKYTVLEKQGEFEVRQYEPRIVAEVRVDGDLDAASGKGFRVLADYIFGKNQAVINATDSEKRAETSAKIAMTAPVTVEPLAYKSEMTEANSWRVEFSMPNHYTQQELPKPLDPNIVIREIPATRYASISYSGMNTESRINQETSKLLDWVKTNNLKAVGAPELARYNPPWTLPMFRRNEIMIPIKSDELNRR